MTATFGSEIVNDTIAGGAGADTIYGGATLGAGGGNDFLDGGGASDTLYGGTNEDSLLGNVGADILDGGDGSDMLAGGSGGDTLYGGIGGDIARGGSGGDTLYGGTGIDTLFGGGGNDLLHADGDDATIMGGGGRDTVIYSSVADTISGAHAIFADSIVLDSGHDMFAPVSTFQAWAATQTLNTISLDGTTGFRLDGVATNDGSGVSVSSAGDVNGDGFADIVVGASGADINGTDSGAAYVVFGKASGWAATTSLSTLDGTNGFRLAGTTANFVTGESVSSAGDINGDGFDDLIVGARFAAPNGSSYVVFGKASGWVASVNLSSLDGTTGFRLDGVAANDSAGENVSAAGDVNGDGLADLLVGARFADPNGTSSGSTYVVFGKASGWTATVGLSSLNGTIGFRLDGAAANDFSGEALSSAGDVNGDGFGDLIVGARGTDHNGSGSGSSYVVFGKASGWAATTNLSGLDGTAGFRLDGVAASDESGFSVSSAGDVNGDGRGDIIVGAHTADANGGDSGASYVVFGKASGWAATIDLANLDGVTGFRLAGTAVAGRSGVSVSSAGDVDGDGFDDLIVGAWQEGPSFNARGSTYVVFGKAAGWAATTNLSSLDGTTGFRLDGAVANDNSGFSVSAAGDVNGDGFDDLIVGAPAADFGGLGAGSSYVVFGHASRTAAYVVDGGAGNDTITGESAADSLSGGADNDRLDGGAGNDRLAGDGGLDSLTGGPGDDTLLGGAATAGFTNALFGGEGLDTASWAGESATVFADLVTGGGHVGGVLVDLMSGIENLTGGSGADVLVGDGLANTLNGGVGALDDLLFGGDGNDVLIGGGRAAISFNQLFGGNGVDTADYSAETGHVFVDLRAPAGHIDAGSGFVLNDLMNSIENATGGSGNDILVGTDADNNSLTGGGGLDLLFGFGGDDLLNGGAGGTGTYNQLFGGTGSDTVSYAFATTVVYADLNVVAGFVTGGTGLFVLNDTYNSVENLIGGSAADSLVGDANANTLTGGGGADLLYGGGGTDRFVYRAATDSNLVTGYDSIADFAPGSEKLDFTAFAITSAQVTILAAGGFVCAVYANTDGIAGNDLALVVTGVGASITMADILF